MTGSSAGSVKTLLHNPIVNRCRRRRTPLIAHVGISDATEREFRFAGGSASLRSGSWSGPDGDRWSPAYTPACGRSARRLSAAGNAWGRSAAGQRHAKGAAEARYLHRGGGLPAAATAKCWQTAAPVHGARRLRPLWHRRRSVHALRLPADPRLLLALHPQPLEHHHQLRGHRGALLLLQISLNHTPNLLSARRRICRPSPSTPWATRTTRFSRMAATHTQLWRFATRPSSSRSCSRCAADLRR